MFLADGAWGTSSNKWIKQTWPPGRQARASNNTKRVAPCIKATAHKQELEERLL